MWNLLAWRYSVCLPFPMSCAVFFWVPSLESLFGLWIYTVFLVTHVVFFSGVALYIAIQVVFFLVTYVVPMVGLSVTYSHLGSILWAAHQTRLTHYRSSSWSAGGVGKEKEDSKSSLYAWWQRQPNFVTSGTPGKQENWERIEGR